MITEKQLKKIRDFAIDLDWNLTFNGNSKGNKHLFRVVKLAKDIGENLNVDCTIVESGAWLHDTNLEKTIMGSTLENKDKIIRFLKKINVSESDQKKIIHCIEAHDGRIPAKTIESKIIHDADTLDKMGPLGIVRETWKRSQLGWNTEKIIMHLIKHIKKREQKLYLEKSKIIAKKLNSILKDFFKIIIVQLNNKEQKL